MPGQKQLDVTVCLLSAAGSHCSDPTRRRLRGPKLSWEEGKKMMCHEERRLVQSLGASA